MPTPSADQRSPRRRAQDEQTAAELPMASLKLPPDARHLPVETYPEPRGHPVAIEGVVENGLIRPLDPAVKLEEHSRVIIVASER